jgi:glycosyltransferase involved in cell wall biosynthesis
MLENRRLGIAILVPALGFGGVERGVLEQARAFAAAGDTVWVIGARGPNVTALFESGARFIEAPLHKKDPLSVWRSIRIFRGFLDHENVDVVEAVSRVPAWVAHLVLRHRKNGPGFLTSAHGFYRPHYLSRAITFGDRVVAVSEVLKGHLVERLGADPARMTVVYRGVDPQEFHPQEPAERAATRNELRVSQGDFAVGMVSRLRRGKGLEVLLEAGARLRTAGVPVVLVFVGVGENHAGDPRKRDRFAARFHRLIAGLNARDWVRLIPPTPRVNALLNALNVAVVPSTIPEAFGRGVIEAMAAGIPVAASRLGAIPEIARDREDALLFEPGNTGALADALAALYNAPEKRRMLAGAGLATVRSRFLLSECLQATRRVLAETAVAAPRATR